VIVAALHAKRLVRGKHLAIDTSVIDADASLRSFEHRLTKERYGQFVTRLATEAGVDTTDPRPMSTFDRTRKGRTTSNDE
jgi:hypothetical protein